MIFDRKENKDVIALLGAGSMGCAIVRKIAAGRKILLDVHIASDRKYGRMREGRFE